MKTYISTTQEKVGGVVGQVDAGGYVLMQQIIVPWDNVVSPSAASGHRRGNIVGGASGTVNFVRAYFANTSCPAGAGSVSSSGRYTVPTSTNYEWVYSNLAFGTKPFGWGTDSRYGVTNGPIFTKTNFIIRAEKGTNISSISGAVGNSSSPYFYTRANSNIYAYADSAATEHQKLKFYYYYSTQKNLLGELPQGSTSRSYTFQGTHDGKVSAEYINIPYPEYLTADYDQWENKMTLNWNHANVDKQAGKWYIYRRVQGEQDWTRTTGQDIETATALKYYSHTITVTQADWDKNWEYAVSFIPSGETVPTVPHTYNTTKLEKSTDIVVDITSFTAQGKDDWIELSAKVATQLVNSAAYSYGINRKKGNGSFAPIVSNQRFDGTGTVSYKDNEPSSSCDSYTYQLEISAFNKSFFSAQATSNITGSNELDTLICTRGEYSNQVRLEWETNKTNTNTSDRYKVFRKVAANTNDDWTEIATINTEEISYIYSDDKAMPGVFYRYKVVMYQVCGGVATELSTAEDIGFAQSLGTVSGRVTYGSGIAVKDVAVAVVRNDLQTNESQYYSLYSKGEGANFSWNPTGNYYENIVRGDFTYQFWLRPAAGMDGTKKVAEIGRLGYVYLVRSGDNYQVQFDYFNASVPDTKLTGAVTIAPGRFSHIAIVRSGDTYKLHIVDDNDMADIQLSTVEVVNDFPDVGMTAGNGLSMGYAMQGYIDECRFWGRALSDEEIKRDFNRMLIGSEEKLKAYWTFDEGIDGDGVEDGYFFDLSRVGTVFNRNHGRHNLVSDTTVPTRDQLALKAITDTNGNYQIRGIPFSGEGTSYDIVPSLGVHKFNPTSQLRYVSNSSLVHNGTDFTDISSFEVKGTVTYEGGDYPVIGCTFEVDDKTVTHADGTPVTSTEDGFKISVPIGEHTVRVVKSGHTFANDGYLTMPEGGYNKNEENKKFFDQTRVKLIGRVVGGLTEYDKPLGFGESVNNTGASKITLTAAQSIPDLQSVSKTDTFNHNGGQWTKPDGRAEDQTEVTYNQKNIEITISAETGEFVAWVYPETYYIEKIEAPGYLEAIYDSRELIDLTSAPVPSDDMLQTSIRTWADSTLVSRPGQVEDYYEYFERSDTVRYHAKWDTYYQATPTFKVTQLVSNQPVGYFGDLEYDLENALTGDSETLTLWDETEGYLFGHPVFKQGKKYTFGFEAYEQYNNSIIPENSRSYAVNQGTIGVDNTIAVTQPEGIALDEEGKARYTFTAGAPDLTTGKRSFFGILDINGKGFYWDKGIEPIEVWHLGDRVTGTDFMTSGPNEITAILRDPPGSLSYSYLEKGTTITTVSSSSVTNGMKEAMDLTTSLGPKITTFVGLGAGIITEVETKIDASVGINSEQTWVDTEETVTTATFTERFETSDDPLYVGWRGDVFIGNSTNIQYGLTNAVSIQRDYLGTDLAFITEGSYSIAPAVSVAYGQTFDTRFAFTQVELEEIMIPKWQENLANLLHPKGTNVSSSTITEPTYVSNLEHDHENFGKLNTDKDTFGNQASTADKFHTGPSYTIHFPDTYDMKKFKVDSVMWFNNQINGWTAVLEQNEREKVQMEKLGNYSFGAGASIEWSKTESTSNTITSSFNWVLNPTIGLETGADVMGIGINLKTNLEYVHEEEDMNGETRETSITSGFVLKEQGDDDELTVDYGMTKSGTIAFKTRGGRTSCPYEEHAVTQYYQPGLHVLSEGTMQIEVPKIDIDGASTVLNVPANKTASFKLAMKNESETGEDVWFQLIVDEITNPNGAELKIDGGIIGNGRMFMVKAGETLTKTMTVGRGTADKYENIALILRSECQADPTTFLPVIADTTFFNVEFIPACNDVNIKSPENNWIVNTNTGTKRPIVLDGFAPYLDTFGFIELQQRKVGTTAWSTLMSFYADERTFNLESSQNKELLPVGATTASYEWDMTNITDGSYELRAKIICVTKDQDGKIITELSENLSDIMTGVKDMSRPEPLGLPTPINGILAASDEISITFNEDIQWNMLKAGNFKVTGLLNESVIAEPNTGLSFTGTGMAYTELPISTNGSFSIETWYKRDNSTAGTLFAYGTSEAFISLGFDAAGHVVMKIGDEVQTSVPAISNTSKTWKYIGLAYNRDDKTVSVYTFGDDTQIPMFVTRAFTNELPVQGKLYAGNSIAGNDGFKGAMGLLHFYNVAHTEPEMSLAKGVTKSGTEPNLIGLWEMNEAEGTIAKDKARSRHLTLSADWYIYPAGRGLALDGIDQHAKLPATNLAFRNYDDFTVELYFKGEAQEATLLSMGTTVYIGFDTNNRMVLNTRGNSTVLTGANLLDGNWHHLALTVKRSGMTTVIIDGVSVNTFSSSIFGEIGGGYYTLGAKFTDPMTTGEYFKGNIDEVRVWGSALSAAVVNKNRKHKLMGDEEGLKAYYPFETWTQELDGTFLVSNLMTDMTDDTISAEGNVVIDNTAVGVLDVPYVDEVGVTYVGSDRKIVLSLTTKLQRLEGVTLDISVQGIMDAYGNENQPVKWTAYVNLSPLNWITDPVDMVMEYGESRTFKATIGNSAGTNTDYYIDGLPSWLSVNAPSGTLAPLATKELTFTIHNGTNIGSYEASVVLAGANEVQKILPVQLKVTGQRPDWFVDPADFEQSMTVTGQVRIEGIPQEDEDDLLAAFIGDTCVGLASPQYEPAFNAYFVYMTVGGNNGDDGKAVTFKLWDAGTGNVYPAMEVTEAGNPLNITFISDYIFGTPDVPVIFNALDVIEQSIAMKNGWNWISVNVTNTNPSLIDQFKVNAIDFASQMKAGDGNYLNNVDGSWIGLINTIANDKMYIVKTDRVATLNMTGKPVKPAETAITLQAGKWSWIGYTPQFTLTVVEALAGIPNPTQNDQVKGQSGYRILSSQGWIGSLNVMEPGRGYKYKSGNTQTESFYYPSIAPGKSSMADEGGYDLYETRWSTDYSQFSTNMTVTASLFIDGVELLDGLYEIAAFSNGECRGSALMEYVDGFAHPFMGFLMVHGEDGDAIEFRAYNHETGEEYVIEESLHFQADAIYGTPDELYALNSKAPTGLDNIGTELAIYPNPVEKELFIRHGKGMIEKVEVFNVSGVMMMRRDNFADASIDVSQLATGTYFIHLVMDGETVVRKFIKK